MNPEKYISYSLRDFAEDDVFVDWVLNEDEEINRLWQKFLENHPEKRSEIEGAKQLILETRGAFSQIKLSKEENVQLIQQLERGIQKVGSKPTQQTSKVFIWSRWAAVIALIFSIGAAIYFSQQRKIRIRYATGYGEIQSFLLPDGSSVKLHANSNLEFDEEWIEGKDRAVWLEGEAFFEVEKKLQTRAKFTVHTQDLNVEVLGTEFNVDTRKDKTEVVLKEGSVKLKLQDKEQKTIIMEPGEMVSFSQKKNKLDKQKIDSRIRISWKEGIQQFEKTPLEEVVVKIEEIYGIRLDIQDSLLLEKNLTIGVPVENLEIALATLESILGTSIVPTTENQFRIK